MPALPSATSDSILSTHIKHVVIIVQENRSFENLFAGYPGADAPLTGLQYASPGPDPSVPLRTITLEGSLNSGPPHGWADAIREWNRGRMDGFNLGIANPDALYSTVEQSETKPYWDMAHEWVLGDRMFPTEFGPSFTAHLDLIAGTTNLDPAHAVVDVPSQTDAFFGWGCAAPSTAVTTLANTTRQLSAGPFPCFTQFRTLADTLDAAAVSWRYYAPKLSQQGGLWSSFQAIDSVYHGRDWKKNVVEPPSTVLRDAREGRLAGVSWVIPDAQDSDHPATHSNLGPSWVASVVNAIGRSKEWPHTVIFVVWDDWGGFYDDAVPPQPGMPFTGYGIRVPFIVISPYAKEDHVSHTVYSFGSIVRFVDQVFKLPPLGSLSDGYTDATAASPLDSLNFSAPARPFTPISAPVPATFFINQRPSGLAPDDD